MSKMKLLTAVAIIVSAAAMLYLAKSTAARAASSEVCKQGSTPNSCLVTITPNTTNPNGPPSVYPPVQKISTNQTVEWKCVSTKRCVWTAVFRGQSPFQDGIFFNSHANSGKPTAPANPTKQYKYSVVVNGTQEADPVIIIQ